MSNQLSKQGLGMPPQSRKRYHNDFKKNAVVQHLETHATLADSALQLGITAGMLSKWVDKYVPEQETSSMNCEKEIVKLKLEIKALKEIMGKAFLQKHTVQDLVDRIVD